ncbi:unnamed protein product [Closterium sp. NIES-53]
MSHPFTPGRPNKARAALPPKSTPTDRLKAARQRSLLRSEMGVLRSRQKRNASRPFDSPGSALPSSSAGASGSSAMKRWLQQERGSGGRRALIAGSLGEDAGSTMGDDAACLADVDMVDGEEVERGAGGAAEEGSGEGLNEGARKRRRLDGQQEGNSEGSNRRDSIVRRLWPGSGGEDRTGGSGEEGGGGGGGGGGGRDRNVKGGRDGATTASAMIEHSELRTETEHDYSADWGLVKVDDPPEATPANDLQLVLLNPREARRAGMVEEDARRWLAELKRTERRLPAALRHRPQEMLEWVAERHGAGGQVGSLAYFRRRLRMWRFLEFLSDYPAEARGVECVEAWCQAMARQEEEEQGRMLGSWESDEEAGDEEELDDDDWWDEDEEEEEEEDKEREEGEGNEGEEEESGEEQHAYGKGGEDVEGEAEERRERGVSGEGEGAPMEPNGRSGARTTSSKPGYRGRAGVQGSGARRGSAAGGGGGRGEGGGGVPWWVAWHGQLAHPAVASRRRLLTRDLECQFASRGPSGRYSELPTYFRSVEGGERRQLAIPLSRMLQQQRQLALLRERDAQGRADDAGWSLALVVVAGEGGGKGAGVGGGRMGSRRKGQGRGGRSRKGEREKTSASLEKQQPRAAAAETEAGQEGRGMWYGGTGRAVGLGTAAEEARMFAPVPVSADEVVCNAPGCPWGVPVLAQTWLKCEKHWDKVHGGGESGMGLVRTRKEVLAEKLVDARAEWEWATHESRDHVVSSALLAAHGLGQDHEESVS